jgi:hypothetical protein
MRWPRQSRWRIPEMQRFADRYNSTSTRDLILLCLYELRHVTRDDDSVLDRVSDSIDQSSTKLEETRLANDPSNPKLRGK